MSGSGSERKVERVVGNAKKQKKGVNEKKLGEKGKGVQGKGKDVMGGASGSRPADDEGAMDRPEQKTRKREGRSS